MKKFGGYKEDGTVVCTERFCDDTIIKLEDDDEAFVRRREKSTNIKFGEVSQECEVKTFYYKVKIDQEEYEIGMTLKLFDCIF